MSDKIRFLSQEEITGLGVGDDHWEVYCLPHLDGYDSWCRMAIVHFLGIFPACAADMVERSTDRRCSPNSPYVGMLTDDFILVWHSQALIDFFLKQQPSEWLWLESSFKFEPLW